MICFVVIFSIVWGHVFGQNENGIYFTNDNSISQPGQPPGNPTTFYGNNCACVITGTCATSGNPNFDVRNVNMPGTSRICPAGYSICCDNPGTDNSCGVRKIPATPQPVGQASFGAFPWQVALLTLQQAYIGSGVLVDATHVLTAAHKVAAYANNPNGMIVRLGEWNFGSQNEPHQYVQAAVAKISLHPGFSSSPVQNDIAVIRLNGVVPIASLPNVNTACKPTAPPVTGQRCYVSGWGQDFFGSFGMYQGIMKETNVPIIDNTQCENRLRQSLGSTFVLNRNSFICAGGEQGKDSCTGDGGSPLVCQTISGQWQVVGLVVGGIGCPNYGFPGVYTNVFNFLPWINQIVATA